MTGPLSQALANAQSAEKEIKAIPGLPAAAAHVQQEAVAQIDGIVPVVQGCRTSVGNFAENNAKKLEAAITALGASTPLSSVVASLSQIQSEAKTLDANTSATATRVTGTNAKIQALQQPLAQIENSLRVRASQLSAQAATKRDEADAAHKKYLYLLALGPFGLVGLAAALTAYEILKSDADKLEASASALDHQVAL
ncbi:MAG: hypothetical protein AAFP86_04705, partial [Planctomycetota bacterium]